jgi:hypothetical protein
MPIEEMSAEKRYANMNSNTVIGSNNSNIIPVMESLIQNYAPFMASGNSNSGGYYPVNFGPNSMSNSNSQLCLINPDHEMCTNSNRPSNMNSNKMNSNANANKMNSNKMNSNKMNSNKMNSNANSNSKANSNANANNM